MLYFPISDVRIDLFRHEGRRPSTLATGTGRLWSIDGQADGPADGRDVLWTSEEPSGGSEHLRGLASFDHDRVRVELVDADPTGDPREVSVKRFPTWGDAADLIDVLDVRPDGPGRFVSVTRPNPRRPVAEGSQILAQAIVAAGRHVPGRRTVSGHMVFLRVADAEQSLHFELDGISGGRTFSTLQVAVTQRGRRCAVGVLLLDVTAPDVVRHAVGAPDVPGPHDCPAHDMSVTGRDIRVVDGAYSGDPAAPVGPPVIDAWVRFHRVPPDPYIHAGLLAQFTGHMSIAAALRPHEGVGQGDAHRTLSTAINAIGISFHGPVHADEWMLYHHESTFAGDGMTHSACRVHDRKGRLVASFTVDAMVRAFAGDRATGDDRTAL